MVRLLARGGQAGVYEATAEGMVHPVALKVVAPSGDAEAGRRFEQEARIAAGLAHPHICRVLEYGQEGTLRYLAMEMVGPESVADRLQRLGRLPVEQAVRIAIAVARALEYAHGRGITHRDVKPSNLLLDRHGDVKITDFGIARALDSNSLTRTGTVVGTPGWMAPEQLQGEPFDHRVDLHALGVVLYQMLSGRHPFESGTPAQTMYRVVHERPPRLGGDVPAWLDDVVQHALEKDPELRYPSAARMAEDLVAERRSRAPRRPRAALLASAAAAVLLAAWGLHRAPPATPAPA